MLSSPVRCFIKSYYLDKDGSTRMFCIHHICWERCLFPENFSNCCLIPQLLICGSETHCIKQCFYGHCNNQGWIAKRILYLTCSDCILTLKSSNVKIPVMGIHALRRKYKQHNQIFKHVLVSYMNSSCGHSSLLQ